MDEIYSEFTSLNAKSNGDISAVVDLAVLFDRFQRLTTWNCPGTGYGKYPMNPSHSTDVSCLTRESQKMFLKCKLHYRFDRLLEGLAPTHPIDW